jgi:hypothetical protein
MRQTRLQRKSTRQDILGEEQVAATRQASQREIASPRVKLVQRTCDGAGRSRHTCLREARRRPTRTVDQVAAEQEDAARLWERVSVCDYFRVCVCRNA